MPVSTLDSKSVKLLCQRLGALKLWGRNTHREDIDTISGQVTDIRGPDISGINVIGPCSKSTAPGVDDAMVVARWVLDIVPPVLSVRPITDGDAVTCPRPRGRSAIERAPGAAVLAAAAAAGTSLVEHRTLSRGSGGGGHGSDDEGGVVGNGFALELDGDPGAGVDAGHEVFRSIRGGSSMSGRSGESSLAEDGQEGEPGKIDDEHTYCKRVVGRGGTCEIGRC